MTEQSVGDERELVDAIEAGLARCCVVGLGHIGASLAHALLAAGFDVRAYDCSAEAVDRFERQTAAQPHLLSVGASDEALADAQVIHVAVNVRCLDRASADLGPLRRLVQSLRRWSSYPRLVILHSTVPPGTTRWFAAEIGRATSTFVAHAPERLQPGTARWTIANTPHIVAGVDASSTRLARRMLRHITAEVSSASAPEVTELAKLMENTFIAVGVALAGEFGRIANAIGVSGTEVAEAAATKPFSYHAFFPGLGVGGHCIPNDLTMLAQLQSELEMTTPLLAATKPSLAQLPELIVARLQQCLQGSDLQLKKASVLLVGLGYKVGSSDTTNTPVRGLIRRLRHLGATAAYFDDGVAAFDVDGISVPRTSLEHLKPDDRFDAAVILSGAPGVAAETLLEAADVVLDASGGRALEPLPQTVVRL